MEIPITTGLPGFCLWFGFPVPHPTTCNKRQILWQNIQHTSGAKYPLSKKQDPHHKVNATSTAPVTLRGEAKEEVEHFTYILAASLTHTQMGQKPTLKPRSVCQGWPFFNWRIFANPKSLPWKTRPGNSVQMSRLFFFMEQRHGGPQRLWLIDWLTDWLIVP